VGGLSLRVLGFYFQSQEQVMRTIKLGYGKGVEGQRACWMTALQSHLGGEWTDRCECVSPSINRLCICINDAYQGDDAARTEDILEFGLFDPIGTNDPAREPERRAIMTRAAREVWAPKAREFAEQAKGSAAADVADAADAADDAAAAYAAAYAADYAAADAADAAAAAAAYAAAYAAYAAAYAAYAAAYAADAAAYAADAAAYAADAYAADAARKKARRDFLQQYVYPVLREMIGPIRQEVVPNEKFYERIGCGV
jgi:hypothetical protein